MKIKLLNKEQLILQNLFYSSLLCCWALLKVSHKLRAGNIKLVHFTREICTCQPANVNQELMVPKTLKITMIHLLLMNLHYYPRVILHQRVVQIESSKIHKRCALKERMHFKYHQWKEKPLQLKRRSHLKQIIIIICIYHNRFWHCRLKNVAEVQQSLLIVSEKHFLFPLVE